MILWRPIDQVPEEYRPILMTGDSGYRAPHDRFIKTGRFEPERHDPWRDEQGSGLQDCGQTPTHWAYLSEIELP